MKARAVLETVLYAADLDAIETFYTDILGLEMVHRDPLRQVFFRCGNAMLLVFNPDVTRLPPTDSGLPIPAHGSKGTGHVCFRASAEEIEEWIVRLKAAEIAIEVDMEWPQGGRSIYFRDPSGNGLEFAEPRIWGLE